MGHSPPSKFLKRQSATALSAVWSEIRYSTVVLYRTVLQRIQTVFITLNPSGVNGSDSLALRHSGVQYSTVQYVP